MKMYNNFNEMFNANNGTTKNLSVFNEIRNRGDGSIYIYPNYTPAFCDIKYYKEDGSTTTNTYKVVVFVYETGGVSQVESIMENLGFSPYTDPEVNTIYADNISLSKINRLADIIDIELNSWFYISYTEYWFVKE